MDSALLDQLPSQSDSNLHLPSSSTFSFQAPFPSSRTTAVTASTSTATPSSSSSAPSPTTSPIKQRRISLALPSAPRDVQAWTFRDDTGLGLEFDSHAAETLSDQSMPQKRGKMRKITFGEDHDFSAAAGEMGTIKDKDKETHAGEKEKRQRKKWTAEETQMLVDGCNRHGVGNWKTILSDATLKFDNRSPVDLKDRFRTYFPDAYKLHYPNARTHLSSKVRSTLPDGTPLFEKMRSKRRRPFTEEEDRALKAGYEKHGTVWAAIVKDPIFRDQGRRSTDLRDRFRNAFPELYQAAGYKPRNGTKKKEVASQIPFSTQQTQTASGTSSTRQEQLGTGTAAGDLATAAGPVRTRRRAHTTSQGLSLLGALGALRGGTKSVPESAACSEDDGEDDVDDYDEDHAMSEKADDSNDFTAHRVSPHSVNGNVVRSSRTGRVVKALKKGIGRGTGRGRGKVQSTPPTPVIVSNVSTPGFRSDNGGAPEDTVSEAIIPNDSFHDDMDIGMQISMEMGLGIEMETEIDPLGMQDFLPDGRQSLSSSGINTPTRSHTSAEYDFIRKSMVGHNRENRNGIRKADMNSSVNANSNGNDNGSSRNNGPSANGMIGKSAWGTQDWLFSSNPRLEHANTNDTNNVTSSNVNTSPAACSSTRTLSSTSATDDGHDHPQPHHPPANVDGLTSPFTFGFPFHAHSLTAATMLGNSSSVLDRYDLLPASSLHSQTHPNPHLHSHHLSPHNQPFHHSYLHTHSISHLYDHAHWPDFASDVGALGLDTLSDVGTSNDNGTSADGDADSGMFVGSGFRGFTHHSDYAGDLIFGARGPRFGMGASHAGIGYGVGSGLGSSLGTGTGSNVAGQGYFGVDLALNSGLGASDASSAGGSSPFGYGLGLSGMQESVSDVSAGIHPMQLSLSGIDEIELAGITLEDRGQEARRQNANENTSSGSRNIAVDAAGRRSGDGDVDVDVVVISPSHDIGPVNNSRTPAPSSPAIGVNDPAVEDIKLDSNHSLSRARPLQLNEHGKFDLELDDLVDLSQSQSSLLSPIKSAQSHNLSLQHHHPADSALDIDLGLSVDTGLDLDLGLELHATPPATPHLSALSPFSTVSHMSSLALRDGRSRSVRRSSESAEFHHYHNYGLGAHGHALGSVSIPHARSVSVPPSEARVRASNVPESGLGLILGRDQRRKGDNIGSGEVNADVTINRSRPIKSPSIPNAAHTPQPQAPPSSFQAQMPASSISQDAWRSTFSTMMGGTIPATTAPVLAEDINLPFLDLHYYSGGIGGMALINGDVLNGEGRDGSERQGQALDLAQSTALSTSMPFRPLGMPASLRQHVPPQVGAAVAGKGVFGTPTLAALRNFANQHQRGQSAVCPQDLVLRSGDNKRKRASWDGAHS